MGCSLNKEPGEVVAKPVSKAPTGEFGALCQPGTRPRWPPPSSWVRLASPQWCPQQPALQGGYCVLTCLRYINPTTLIRTICGSPEQGKFKHLFMPGQAGLPATNPGSASDSWVPQGHCQHGGGGGTPLLGSPLPALLGYPEGGR